MTDLRLRGATWIAVSLAIFNQFAGINIVNVYSMVIFEKLGDDLPYTPKTGTYFVGFAGFIGAFFAPITFLSLSRRANFIGSHMVFLVFLLVIYATIKLKQPIVVLVSIVLVIIVF